MLFEKIKIKKKSTVISGVLTTLFFSLSIFTLKSNILGASSNFQQEIYPLTQCNDGIDNDGDGGIDFAFDAQCHSWTDDTEDIDDAPVPPPVPPIPPPASVPENPPQVNPPGSTPPSGNFFNQIIDIPVTQRDIDETESPSNFDSIEDAMEKYLWSPLGSLLNIPPEINASGESVAGLNIFQKVLAASCCCIYIILMLLALVFFLRRRKEKEEKIED